MDNANGCRLNDRIILVHLKHDPEVKSAVVKGNEHDPTDNQSCSSDQATAGDTEDTTSSDIETDTETDPDTDLKDDPEREFLDLDLETEDNADDEDYQEIDCEMQDDGSDADEYSYNASEKEVVESVDQRTFSIHENVLRSNSPYFDRALRADWEEGRRGEIYLGKFDPDAFEVYARWAYTGRIFVEVDRTFLWKNCYVLGRYLCDTDFNDALVDNLVKGMSQKKLYYPNFVYEVMYKLPGRDSPHRKLAVDVFLLSWRNEQHTDTSWMPDFERVGMEFIHDVMAAEQGALRKEKVSRWGRECYWLDWKNDCRYHEHANEGRCYRDTRKHLYVDPSRKHLRYAAGFD